MVTGDMVRTLYFNLLKLVNVGNIPETNTMQFIEEKYINYIADVRLTPI